MAPSSSLRPQSPVCREKQRLIDEFIAAARVVITLQSQQIAAMTGDPAGVEFDFEKPLLEAQQRKEDALRAYALHLEQHRC